MGKNSFLPHISPFSSHYHAQGRWMGFVVVVVDSRPHNSCFVNGITPFREHRS
jgi:hypothetical protein